MKRTTRQQQAETTTPQTPRLRLVKAADLEARREAAEAEAERMRAQRAQVIRMPQRAPRGEEEARHMFAELFAA